MKLFVFHTPEAVPEGIPDCAIVVDILRATTTIATALHAGADFVQVFASLEALDHASATYPPDRRLRAAERSGKKVEGYDLGNSPLDCTPEVVQGKGIFMSTTNGTRALQRVQAAPHVVAAALINLNSVVQFVQKLQPETLWIVGSGWEGSFSLEDTVCAGAIATKLTPLWVGGNDEVFAASALYAHWHDRLEELFHLASHGQRLLKLQGQEDIAYCAQQSVIEVLPHQVEPGVLRAL